MAAAKVVLQKMIVHSISKVEARQTSTPKWNLQRLSIALPPPRKLLGTAQEAGL